MPGFESLRLKPPTPAGAKLKGLNALVSAKDAKKVDVLEPL